MAKRTALAPEQLRALDRLTSIQGIERFYLAGGSGIAVHLRHRRSRDLDLFTRLPGEDLDRFRAAAVKTAGISLIAGTDVAVKLLVADVEVDAVRYPYPPLGALVAGPRGILVASLADLAAMKLAAVSRRGVRRDFWDLHAIIGSGMSLPKVCRAFVTRFGKAESDLYHVLRALTYFDDAEADRALPEGLTEKKWAAIKTFFEREAPKALVVLGRRRR